MRRLYLTLLGLSWLALFAGCHHYCSHGVCDCLFDDQCCTRAPWVKLGPPAVLGAPIDAGPAPIAVPPVVTAPMNDLP